MSPNRHAGVAAFGEAMLREAVEVRIRTAEVVTTVGTQSYAGVFVKEALHIGK